MQLNAVGSVKYPDELLGFLRKSVKVLSLKAQSRLTYTRAPMIYRLKPVMPALALRSSGGV